MPGVEHVVARPFLGGVQAGIGGRRVRQALHDLRRDLGRRADDHRVARADDPAAGRIDERVEPHDQPLVLGALLLDVVRLALLGQLLGVIDHLVPGLGRRLDQVLAVPEQLGVGVDRRGPQPAVVGGRLQRAGQHALGDRGAVGAGPRPDPARRRELGGPVDVHREDVDRRVAGGEPLDQRLALLVRRVGEEVDVDLVRAVRRRRAVGGGLRERAGRLREHQPVERDRALAGRATARCDSDGDHAGCYQGTDPSQALSSPFTDPVRRGSLPTCPTRRLANK